MLKLAQKLLLLCNEKQSTFIADKIWYLKQKFLRDGIISLLVGVGLQPLPIKAETTVDTQQLISQATHIYRIKQIAQQSGNTQQNATRADAGRVYQEGAQLYQQGTAESLRQAIGKFLEALKLWQQINDKRSQAATLNNIGSIYYLLGEKQQALTYYNQALPIARAVGDRAGEATILAGIGDVYNDLGENQQALT